MLEEPAPDSAPPDIPEPSPDFVRFIDEQRGTSKRFVEQALPACEKLMFLATPTEVLALEFASTERGIPFRRCRDGGRQIKYFDLGLVGGERILAVQTEMGPFAEGGSAARAIYYRSQTQANAIISLGMAFGTLPRHQKIGDVLIAEGVLPYDNKTVTTGDGGRPSISYDSVDLYPSNRGLLDRFKRKIEAAEWKGKALVGLFLSGGARIHCAAFRDELAQGCSAGKGGIAIGGDMEGVGFLSASIKENPTWILVKGISDFADHHRDSIIRRSRILACQQSARFVLDTLLTS